MFNNFALSRNTVYKCDMNSKKHDSDLIEVQRGVITQGTDGGQFNQGVILRAPHWFTILVPEDKHLCCYSPYNDKNVLK